MAWHAGSFAHYHRRVEFLAGLQHAEAKHQKLAHGSDHNLLSLQAPLSRQATKGSSALDLLKSLAEDPGLSLHERALKLGVPETSMRHSLEGLRKGSFVEQGADKKYRLTTKGRKEILPLV